MKKLLLLIASFAGFGSGTLFSQYTQLNESDKQVLQALDNNKDRVDTLVEWAYDGAKKYSEEQYINVALSLADKARYAKGRADCLVKMGHIAGDSGNYLVAEKLHRSALHIRDSLGDLVGTASCFNNLGVLQKNQSRYDSAVILFQDGLKQLEKLDPGSVAIDLHNNLGTALRYLGKYEQSLSHFHESMSLSRQLSNLKGIASARMNIGALLQDNLSLYKEALDSLKLSLKDFIAIEDQANIAKCYLNLGSNTYLTNDLLKALEYYERARNLGDHLDKNDRAIVLKNRGRVYLEQRKNEKALADFRSSLDTFTALGNLREIAAVQTEMGNFYYEQGQLEPAVEHYKMALEPDAVDPIVKTRLLYFLSFALDELGHKEEAAMYTDQYISLLGSLDTSNTRGAFEEMVRYQIGKDRLIKQLLEQEKQNFRNYAIAGLAGLSFLLVLAVLAAWLNRERRRHAEQNEKIARQGEELARQNEEIARQREQIAIREKFDLLREKEMETHYARLEGQDDMQKKIGQELHDSVGAMLSTVKINLAPVDEVLDLLPENKRQNYIKANHLLDEACEEVRRIAHELTSAVLTRFGLKAQLEALADIVPGSGKIEVELVTHGLREKIGNKLELNIYRIVQELVNNVIKHAQASKISIQVSRFDDMVNIIVEDNGRGLDTKKVRESPGIGMQNIVSRVHDLDGKMHLDSQLGRGTTVSIDFPLTESFKS